MTVVFQHILAAVDGSESSLRAADAAIALAALLHARLDLISVEETAPRYVSTQEENRIEQSAATAYYERLHEPLRQKAEQQGVQVCSVIVSGHEGQNVLDYITQQQCDLLVLGYRGHSGVWGAFLGSTADKLVSHAPCSVLVIRSRWGKTLFRHILVALDCSPLSWQAFRMGLHLGKQVGAFVNVLSVVESVKVPPANGGIPSTGEWDWKAYFQQAQALTAAELQVAGLNGETLTEQGSASTAITAASRDKGVDLAVLGATGQEHPWSAITGGTARKVANAASCAVLIVRPLTRGLRVRDVMNTGVIPVTADTGLSEVIDRLVSGGERLLIVVDDQQRVIGIITLGHLLSQEAVIRQLDLQRATGTGHLDQYVDHLITVSSAVQTAADVMRRHPLVVADTVSIEDAARRMDTEHVTRMPVIDESQQMVGVLDQAHLLSYFVAQPSVAETIPANPPSIEFPRLVGECVLAQAPLVGAETPLFEVLRQIQETSIRRVIVIDGTGKAIGVIADSDILAARGLITRQNPVLALAGRFSLRFPKEFLRRLSSSGPLTAQQVMRPHLFAVMPATPVAEAVQLMLAHHIKRLVVVDVQGKPLGMVDRQQLLRAFIEGGTVSI
jgi:nucleotide-binding universal stress UspA family protein/predicted transcriptional regulator